MNALSKILGGVAGLAALWAGGWYAGKAFFVEPEADRVVEELRAGNLFFSYETREVGGFPTGYDVAYQGVEISNGEGWRWSAPRTTIAAGVANIGALTVTPSDESKLTVNAAAFGFLRFRRHGRIFAFDSTLNDAGRPAARGSFRSETLRCREKKMRARQQKDREVVERNPGVTETRA